MIHYITSRMICHGLVGVSPDISPHIVLYLKNGEGKLQGAEPEFMCGPVNRVGE